MPMACGKSFLRRHQRSCLDRRQNTQMRCWLFGIDWVLVGLVHRVQPRGCIPWFHWVSWLVKTLLFWVRLLWVTLFHEHWSSRILGPWVLAVAVWCVVLVCFQRSCVQLASMRALNIWMFSFIHVMEFLFPSFLFLPHTHMHSSLSSWIERSHVIKAKLI
jgi:hypothetical protein